VDHLTRLLVAARDGDRVALDRFVAETQADVWRMCRYLGDAQFADDLAQETYERAIGSIHRFRATGRLAGGCSRSPAGRASTTRAVPAAGAGSIGRCSTTPPPAWSADR
jgi:hypothetical protein